MYLKTNYNILYFMIDFSQSLFLSFMLDDKHKIMMKDKSFSLRI